MLNQRSDKVELLRIAEAVALEKSIDKELIISSMERGIAKAAKSKFGQDNEIAVLIDRGNRELPIQPDYVGHRIETKRLDDIKVCFKEHDGRDAISLITEP